MKRPDLHLSCMHPHYLSSHRRRVVLQDARKTLWNWKMGCRSRPLLRNPKKAEARGKQRNQRTVVRRTYEALRAKNQLSPLKEREIAPTAIPMHRMHLPHFSLSSLKKAGNVCGYRHPWPRPRILDLDLRFNRTRAPFRAEEAPVQQSHPRTFNALIVEQIHHDHHRACRVVHVPLARCRRLYLARRRVLVRSRSLSAARSLNLRYRFLRL